MGVDGDLPGWEKMAGVGAETELLLKLCVLVAPARAQPKLRGKRRSHGKAENRGEMSDTGPPRLSHRREENEWA